MNPNPPYTIDETWDSENPLDAETGTPEADLWFLPGPPVDEPDFMQPGPKTEPDEGAVLVDWAKAEAHHAAKLARAAGRLGALDERFRRGPEGWRHRLALIEAAELSWYSGDRISSDRLALWAALRVSSVQEDGRALIRAGWAVRRLSGGLGPEAGLPEFLGRHDPEMGTDPTERFTDRAESWLTVMRSVADLHPITRACMGYHLWALAGLSPTGDRLEAAVTAARIAVGDAKGAVFAPLAMGGAGALRSGGDPAARLGRWLEGMTSGIVTAMRTLDDIEAWEVRAYTAMKPLSGRTLPALRAVLTEWPLISAPMAETLTTASRAAVQRNLAWMEAHGLIKEITGQGRFRMWRAAV